MKLTKKQILGVNITVTPKEEILSIVEEYIHRGSEAIKKSPLVVATPNPEQVMLATTDTNFRLVLNRADVALPDGTGVVFAMRFLRGISTPRISGVDFMSDLVRLANKTHAMIGFIGGRNDVANKALLTLQSSYIELHGWSEQPKEFETIDEIQSFPMDKIVRRIIDSQTRCVFVGFGAPKQEIFIDTLKKALVSEHAGPVILMSVGGSFDMLAGIVPRAPIFLQKSGLEWLYRLFREPWRWRRQRVIISFLLLVLREKIVHNKKEQ